MPVSRLLQAWPWPCLQEFPTGVGKSRHHVGSKVSGDTSPLVSDKQGVDSGVQSVNSEALCGQQVTIVCRQPK